MTESNSLCGGFLECPQKDHGLLVARGVYAMREVEVIEGDSSIHIETDHAAAWITSPRRAQHDGIRPKGRNLESLAVKGQLGRDARRVSSGR